MVENSKKVDRNNSFTILELSKVGPNQRDALLFLSLLLQFFIDFDNSFFKNVFQNLSFPTVYSKFFCDELVFGNFSSKSGEIFSKFKRS